MEERSEAVKPLGGHAYGSIPHLSGSAGGRSHKRVSPGEEAICCRRVRDPRDRVWIQEKLDGSCCVVLRTQDALLPLIRSGYPAATSPYDQHRWFADWVEENAERFLAVLRPGERLAGEWLAQAHATRYDLAGREPFVPFDILQGQKRLPVQAAWERLQNVFPEAVMGFMLQGPMPPEAAYKVFAEKNRYRALDPVEGVVYRVERNGSVLFLAKWVAPNKTAGVYLPEISGQPAVWNWRPQP